jgi:hypothetical protein
MRIISSVKTIDRGVRCVYIAMGRTVADRQQESDGGCLFSILHNDGVDKTCF